MSVSLKITIPKLMLADFPLQSVEGFGYMVKCLTFHTDFELFPKRCGRSSNNLLNLLLF